MGRGRFTAQEIAMLKKNPYVSDVNEQRIFYTNEFKFHFIDEYLAGKKPTQIFKDAGFDPKMLGTKRIERATQRWKESYAAGSLGNYKNSTFSKQPVYFQDNEYLKILKTQGKQIEELQADIEFLKKELLKHICSAS